MPQAVQHAKGDGQADTENPGEVPHVKRSPDQSRSGLVARAAIVDERRVTQDRLCRPAMRTTRREAWLISIKALPFCLAKLTLSQGPAKERTDDAAR
jgi:hypothetical protein